MLRRSMLKKALKKTVKTGFSAAGKWFNVRASNQWFSDGPLAHIELPGNHTGFSSPTPRLYARTQWFITENNGISTIGAHVKSEESCWREDRDGPS